jgi:hypothetical protein
MILHRGSGQRCIGRRDCEDLRSKSALRRALLFSLFECEIKAEVTGAQSQGPQPVDNDRFAFVVPEGAAAIPIRPKRVYCPSPKLPTWISPLKPAKGERCAGLSTPRLALPLKYEWPRDIREPITRLTAKLQSMGGLLHRAANPVDSGGRARKEYTCRPMIRTTPGSTMLDAAVALACGPLVYFQF